ncbi:amidohydrolase [Pseudomonas sp. NBRC 111118]|uniref:amidohydrolase family protein n=1 Tax=Pseudomonas sp. NBRC 111118 TaxID=1661033 RepID=UPI0009E740A4|nr:amidohydrolase family protein [Pseudomonas sp. NBRC 111118]
MNNNNTLIDSHVHFFKEEDLTVLGSDLPYKLPDANPLVDYLSKLESSGIKPVLLNNVHLSILPDSANVFASFDELAQLQLSHPGKYDHIRLVGTIKADPDYANEHRLRHHQVVGIRIVLHDAPPESVDPGAYSTLAWTELYDRLASHQHVHIYAQSAQTNLLVLRQIPRKVRVIIDHLGTCQVEKGAHDSAFLQLLQAARERGNIWFKGPGYRTSTDIARVKPFVARILDVLGADKLMLQASDAPHVGADQAGSAYSSMFDPASAFDFVRQLATAASECCTASADDLLHGAALTVFPNQ